MKHLFLSIIIPTYNTDYASFERCIDSTLNIKIPYEILIIDDGSTAVNLNKYKTYIANFKQVRLLRQVHAGVSVARNLGIANSSGKYLFFLDSDDELSNEFIDYLNNHYRKITADFILSGFIFKNLMENTVRYESIVEKKLFVQDLDIFSLDYEYYIYILASTGNLNSVNGKLFKKNLLIFNEVKFSEGVFRAEDRCFMINIMNYIKEIQVIPRYIYIVNHIPKKERLLKNPKRMYIDVFAMEQELLKNIFAKLDAHQARLLQKKQKSNIIRFIVRDFLFLIEEDSLTVDFKKNAYEEMYKFGLFENFDIRHCQGIKSKVGYFLLKNKCYFCISFIARIKPILQKMGLMG